MQPSKRRSVATVLHCRDAVHTRPSGRRTAAASAAEANGPAFRIGGRKRGARPLVRAARLWTRRWTFPQRPTALLPAGRLGTLAVLATPAGKSGHMALPATSQRAFGSLREIALAVERYSDRSPIHRHRSVQPHWLGSADPRRPRRIPSGSRNGPGAGTGTHFPDTLPIGKQRLGMRLHRAMALGPAAPGFTEALVARTPVAWLAQSST